jgi:putative ABC transport system substrate-binding protein
VCALGMSAQPAERPKRVGLLVGMADDLDGRLRVMTFQRRLRQLGWIDGENLQLDIRWSAGDLDRMHAQAQELIGFSPDVLVGASLPVAATFQHMTRSIPIVFLVVPDPVRNGFVANQAEPEGNLTGFASFDSSMGGKWLEILRGIASRIARLGLMSDPMSIARGRRYISSIEDAARPFGIEIRNFSVRSAGDIELAVDQLGREPGGGLIVLPDNTVVHHRELIVSRAALRRLPAVYPYRYFAASGGLVSYGIDTVDLYSRAAPYVDRILRGAKPGELPVQEPIKFELVINLNAAKMIGVDVPPAVIACANEVIE